MKRLIILSVIVLFLWVFIPYNSDTNWFFRIWRINIAWLDSDFAGIEAYHGTGRLKVAWNSSYGTAVRYNWTERKWQIIEEKWSLFGFDKV